MKVVLATLFIALAFVACTKKEEAPATPPAAAPVTEAPATAPAAPAPDANTAPAAPAAPATEPAPTGK